MSDREITAELQVGDLAAVPVEPPTVFALVTLGAKTDLGRMRENNEDKFDWLEPESDDLLAARGRLYAVADGMGGHAAGQIASELALKTLLRSYYEGRSPGPADALRAAIRSANALVWEASHRIPGRSGMGTTVTVLVLTGDRAIIGQVGDSRAYLLREGEIRQITEDHSWVAEQVRAEVMTLKEAEASPYRNVITRSIGAEPEVTADLYEVAIRPDDRFLLCSDGLSGVVDPDEMKESAEAHSPSMAAWRLIDLANDRGGPDNVTCLILRIDDIVEWTPQESGEGPKASDAAPVQAGVGVPIGQGDERAPSGPTASSDLSAPFDRSAPSGLPASSDRPAPAHPSAPSLAAAPRRRGWFGLKR